MKLYKVTWSDNDEGSCVRWAGSKAEGRKVLAEARRSARHNRTVMTRPLVEAVEFRPTKAGVLALLQSTPGYDNG